MSRDGDDRAAFDVDVDVADDEAARRRIRSALDASLLVEAAAGTGKTTELVRRLVAVLASGRARVDRVVAVTFTRKAAGELKLRLRQELDRARVASADAAERAHLDHALAHLEEAHVGTIHSFCAEVLRQRPVEAGVDPAFREADEEEAEALYGRAFQRWIERRLDDPSPGLRRSLARLAGERDRDGSSPLDRLRRAGWDLVDWRDFAARWSRRPFAREERVDEMVDRVTAMAELVRRGENPHHPLRRGLEPVVALDEWRRLSERVSRRDHDELEARLGELLRDLKRNRFVGRGKHWGTAEDGQRIAREAVVEARDELVTALEAFADEAGADLAALLRDELAEVVAEYEEAKRKHGVLDFLDLLIRARDLVRDQPPVRRHLQERFTHLFVDEFQDTDPLQAEILLLLAADDPEERDWRRVRPAPGKLFLVGDPKQSIYRFRRADVVLYRAIREQLAAGGVERLHLTRSFRALRPLQQAVNAAFRPAMDGDAATGQPDYVPLGPARTREGEQPTVVALPVPRPYGYRAVTKYAVDRGQPPVVAAWLDWLLRESGWTVEEPGAPGRRVPISPRHVAILFRRFVSWHGDVTRDYVRELEARGIPHLLVGGRSFHQREEVETLRAALTAVEWPDDELAVFATLKGSLFAIADDLLLRFREEVSPRFHPFRRLPDDLAPEFLPIAQALGLLAELHRRRNRVPIVETLVGLLAETRAHAGFALRPAGNQVLANVQHVCDLARSFELRGGLSFRGFVDRLTAEAERPGPAQAPALEEGADGVRLLTVHAAKGLEFPVLVLADVTANLARAEPDRTVDAAAGLAATRILGCAPWELREAQELEAGRDAAEGVRVAYVAATRARDLLAVPVVGDRPWEGGWTSPLARALYPPPARWRESRPAPGCPTFGDRSVLERPVDFDGHEETSVRPGLHRPELGDHEVVWWDPAVLRLDAEGNYGLEREEVLAEDDAGAAQAGLDRYEAWRDERERILDAGRRPEREVVTVTAGDDEPPGGRRDVAVERLPRPPHRPAGRRFGTLVHVLLRDAALDAGDTVLGQLARHHGRLLAATADEVEAAVATVAAAFRHPLLRRAAAAPRRHRELPFLLPLGEGRLLEGTLDLAFLEDGTWTVVDFKTDVATGDLAARYQRQLAWYVHALEKATGQPARGVLLAV